MLLKAAEGSAGSSLAEPTLASDEGCVALVSKRQRGLELPGH
jgi:hypothetical protein